MERESGERKSRGRRTGATQSRAICSAERRAEPRSTRAIPPNQTHPHQILEKAIRRASCPEQVLWASPAACRRRGGARRDWREPWEGRQPRWTRGGYGVPGGTMTKRRRSRRVRLPNSTLLPRLSTIRTGARRRSSVPPLRCRATRACPPGCLPARPAMRHGEAQLRAARCEVARRRGGVGH